MNKNNRPSKDCIGCVSLFAILFIVLKLIGEITWNWIIVALVILFFTLLFLAADRQEVKDAEN